FCNEFRFLLWPTTTLVAEYRIQFTTYQSSNADAVSHFILAGFDHSFSPEFNASFRGGFQIRSLDFTQMIPASIQIVNGFLTFVPAQTIHTSADSTSPYFEATLNYAVGKKTSLSWTNRYGIEEPDIPGQPKRVTTTPRSCPTSRCANTPATASTRELISAFSQRWSGFCSISFFA